MTDVLGRGRRKAAPRLDSLRVTALCRTCLANITQAPNGGYWYHSSTGAIPCSLSKEEPQ